MHHNLPNTKSNTKSDINHAKLQTSSVKVCDQRNNHKLQRD